MNFEEIWERVREKTGMENLYELAEFVGKKRQFISKKKKLNQFETDWAFKVAQEYGVSTDWIMTGKHPEKIDRIAEAPKKQINYLVKVENWLTELIKNDPRNKDWFEKQFESAFPQFETWCADQKTEGKTYGRQPQTVRENVD